MNFPKNVDLTNPFQKGLALILAAVVAVGVYMLLPPMIVFIKNLWLFAIYGIPLGFMIYNYEILWHWFKKLSWELTKWSISMDRPGYLYKYHEYLVGKVEDLGERTKKIISLRVSTTDKIRVLKDEVDALGRSGAQARSMGKTIAAGSSGTKAVLKQKLIDQLVPRLEYLMTQEKSLKELLSIRTQEAADLKDAIDAKIDEYDTLKEIDKGFKDAGASMDENSMEFKTYKETLKQMTEQVNLYTASIEMFDTQLKPIIEKASIDKAANEAEGLKFIEEYKANRFVPEFKLLANSTQTIKQ